MVPPSKKRKLPTPSGPSPKRTKDSSQTTSKRPNATKSKKKAPKPAKRGQAVDVSSLKWQSVGEEFGALEVIEGVDVVKDGTAVQFVVSQSDDNNAKTPPSENDRQDAEEESFEGFGDDPVEGQGVDPDKTGNSEDTVEDKIPQGEASKQGQGKKNKSKKQQLVGDSQEKQPKNKSATTKKKVQEPTSSGGNSFDALAGMADVQDDEETDMAAWADLNLSPPILSAIAKLGFAKPTRIQEKTIPDIVAGEDVIGKAQTGSGKTLAFAIPIVERWLERFEGEAEEQDEQDNNSESEGDDADKSKAKRKDPIALILSPTRELAKQLGDHIKALCAALPNAPWVCVVTGGLSIHKQQRQLQRADIIIGTPGRLWEVLEGDMDLQRSFTMIKFLVVDEADRLFKAGQFKEAENIIGALDRRDPEAQYGAGSDDGSDELPPRQTLVFSATFDKDLQHKLAGHGKSRSAGADKEDQMAYLMKSLQFRQEPKFVDANPVRSMADGLKEGLIECGAMEKDLYLYTILVLNPGRRTLVFTNSISAVRRLTPFLTNLGLGALPLHSQMAQKARLRSLERFTATRDGILVATDVAARGLDIKQVDQVLHYHVPRAADTYIHRSGRTARGEGETGLSVLLCSPDEVISTRRLAGRVHEKREKTNRRNQVIQTLVPDRKIVQRLKPRVALAKRLADAVLAKEKGHGDDTWLRTAADDLGVEYDAEDFDESAPSGWGGRGGGRKRKEKEARTMSKAEMGALRAELREDLAKRVNLGVSERYIAGGRVNMAALLKDREKAGSSGMFLGGDGLGLGI